MTRSVKVLALSAFIAIAAAGFMLIPASDVCAIDAECTTITNSGNVGPATGNGPDCPWAVMDARNKLGSQMSSFCSPDKICDSHIDFGSCVYTGGGNYRVIATGWVECGRFF